MSTNPQRPLPLPASAIPDGCLPWDGEQTRRWTQALPPRWVPVRLDMSVLVAVSLAGFFGSGALALYTDVSPWAAAVVALHAIWLAVRPEIVRVSVPVLLFLVPVQQPLPWAVAVPALAVLLLVWAVAMLRLVARGRQRAAALAAAGGVTAVLPDEGKTFRRGKLLAWFGLAVTVAGAAWAVTFGLGEGHVLPASGLYVIGLGLTAVLSGLLGRRRAAVLRGAPAPVLRVLVRENAEVDAEVYAADDLGALRPLFTVSVSELEDEGEPFFEEADDEDFDEEAAEAEMREVLDRIDDEEPGPLREAVLYGTPYDGAEILLVSADEEPGEPPLFERSQGPVRPLSDRFGQSRVVGEKRAGTRKAAYQELGRLAAEAAAELVPGAVRRWRAGRLDRLIALVVVLWFVPIALDESGWFWRYVLVGSVALGGALMLPGRLAWTVTADSEGLWFNGLLRIHHIAWDDIRVVRCKGTELKIDSRRSGFPTWTMYGIRWPKLELRRGWIHPYERTAAEITAMWQDPALRPTATATGRERGRPLWPLALALAVVFAAALVLLP
ncbi:hypothetical protein HLK59_36535 [Streptomyces sp. S3(2020)]|uniref:hypothetical protein n=1 Tax=Streptomyces sp. S3(2020) TaxID=2732044 RepID=UPI001489205D|nr:hypothetical protein [Streptomyces sp. S3(2020)]NNN35777.1 hypothetical protein [Streptomyces sp. S3(2020)]